MVELVSLRATPNFVGDARNGWLGRVRARAYSPSRIYSGRAVGGQTFGAAGCRDAVTGHSPNMSKPPAAARPLLDRVPRISNSRRVRTRSLARTLSPPRVSRNFRCAFRAPIHRKHRASRMRKIHNKRVVKIADDRDIVQSCIVASEGSDQIDFEPPVAGYRSIVINIRIWRIVEKGSRKMSKIWRVDNCYLSWLWKSVKYNNNRLVEETICRDPVSWPMVRMRV